MAKIVTRIDEDTELVIPAWVTDNASFVRWAASVDAPEKGKFGFFQNEVWLDTTMETEFHNLIKSAIAIEVGYWCKQQKLGVYYTDGMLLSLPDLSTTTQPDGMFVSNESRATGKVATLAEERRRVLHGAPDLILEVISRSSRQKDEALRETYHEAGIAEYWLVDSQSEDPRLNILRYTNRGYVSVRSQEGWTKSTVLNAQFRLVFAFMNNQPQVELVRKQ